MRCHHFDAGACRSCTLLDVPHTRQITTARRQIEELLAPFVDQEVQVGPRAGAPVWAPPVLSADGAFRNKAKMVVTGTANDPVLGILGPDGAHGKPGVDLSDCPLYPDPVHDLLTEVKGLIRRAQVPPYDIGRRRGELKNVLVTVSADDQMMLRLVLRSRGPLDRIREHLPVLLEREPRARVVTANIHPEHKAVVEGAEEVHLAGDESLPMRMGDVTLTARPQSFLQTNTQVASQLYRQVAAWVDEIETEHDRTAAADASLPPSAPVRLWDLYCGVGGFALHCARADGSREVTGVEISAQAIDAARETAAEAGVTASFHAADATQWAQDQAHRTGPPDVVIVNPPRRGIGGELADWIERSGVRDVVYSSCNPVTLARDLEAMPSYRIVAGRLVDMFPHTRHDEVVVRLRRAQPIP